MQYLSIRTDITLRKENQERLGQLGKELAQKNRDLETVVYVASHDLRSPLVNVQGFSKELALACERLKAKLSGAPGEVADKGELLTLLSEDVPEALSYIHAGVVKMEMLISSLLRFSRLGRAALRIGPFEMNTR